MSYLCNLQSQKKILNKLKLNPSTEQGGRINIDVSSVQTPSYRGANFCLLFQNYFTGYLSSYFIKQKSDLPASLFDWLQRDTLTFK
jgi:hypothetical protein